jgi:hypothetical protein
MMDFGEAAMSRDELGGFLMDEPRYASVASLRRDGAPFVTPLGFVYDGDCFYFSIPPTRAGTKRMRRDPRVCVTVYNDCFPTRFFIATGLVTEMSDPNDAISLAIHNRYPHPGVDTEQFQQSWLSTGKVVFRFSFDDYASSDLTKVDLSDPKFAMTPEQWNEKR